MAKKAAAKAVRFTVTGHNTVIDAESKREWIQDASIVPGFEGELTWEEGFKAVAELNKAKFAGHNDWRMPSRPEQESILDLTKHSPAHDPIFKGHRGWHWTSTPHAAYPDLAWIVGMMYGIVLGYGKGFRSCVRPVRASQ